MRFEEWAWGDLFSGIMGMDAPMMILIQPSTPHRSRHVDSGYWRDLRVGSTRESFLTEVESE